MALASHDQFMTQYHQALCQEIEDYFVRLHTKPLIKTIYLGGGTPSTYPDHLLLDMFATLRRYTEFDQKNEVTIEVNPGTVRNEQLFLWKELGINRLSIGVQSLNDQVLQSLNRKQTKDDVCKIIADAATVFDNVSIDLILGLPGVSEQEWQATINEVCRWPIKHISVYFLTVHEDTPLHFKVISNKVKLPDDDYFIASYHWTVQTLAAAGFARYEISNFAQPGYESSHNSAYWDRSPYQGFGLGACSFNGMKRMQNEKRLLTYIDAAMRHESVVSFEETLTEDQIRLEKIFLNLRRVGGVSWDDLLDRLSDAHVARTKEKIDLLCRQGFIDEYNGRLRLTSQGLVVENEVIAQL